MKCCNAPAWAMWHPGCREVVAYGCRRCGGVQMIAGREMLLKWAIEDWDASRSFLNHPTDKEYGPRADAQTQLARDSGKTKRCLGCAKVLPLVEFNARDQWDRKGNQRREVRCRPCHRAALNARRRGEVKPSVVKEPSPDLPEGVKKCAKCELVLPISEYYRRKYRGSGTAPAVPLLRRECRECGKRLARAAYEKKMLKQARENR
jgi:hypothetical protein